MAEFLTLNARTVGFTNWTGLYLCLSLVGTLLLAFVVTAFLDKYGAPDDDVSFDPRYDRW